MRKNRVLAGVLTATLVLGSLTLPENISFSGLNFGTFFAQAAEIVDSGTCGDNLTWTLDEDGLLTISGTGEMDTSNSTPWTWLWTGEITEVKIENGVTSIESNAFSECGNMTKIEIPDSVTSIGAGAFSGCSSLTSIEIPNGVTKIEENTFSYCSSLTSVNIPNGVTYIADWAFNECNSLPSIDIPNSVTSIGEGAFSSCGSFTNIEIPNSVISIGAYAFCYCGHLTSIDIPNSVTSIGEEAFFECDSLTSIEIPDSVTSIGVEAFCGCSHLTKVEISNSLTSIQERTFSGCSNLTKVEIPDGVTSIGEGAFCECYNLTSIEIPDSVVTIWNNAFEGCSSLTSIKIPDNETSIRSYVFSSCLDLTSIEIPDSVTNIWENAFYWCDNLTDVYYQGSEDEWNAIVISEDGNDCLSSATIHYNSSLPEVNDEEDILDTEGSDYFYPYEDGNSFGHSADYFFDSGEKQNYSTNYKEKLLEQCTLWDKCRMQLRFRSSWGGSCSGVATTIALANMGLFDLCESGEYINLDAPKDDTELRDEINYYHLLQYVSDYEESYQTYRDDWTETMISLSDFLFFLVDEAERCQEEQVPFLLSYLHTGDYTYEYNEETRQGSSGGHSVVVCGCHEGEYRIDGTEYKYSLVIFDINAQYQYRYFYINEDYTEFYFVDGNHVPLHEVWESMWLISASDLQSSFYESPSEDTSSVITSDVDDTGYVHISINAHEKFTITNADGETLSYENGEYNGTMNVHSEKVTLNDTEDGIDSTCTYILTVDASDSFTVEGFEEGFEVAVEIDDNYYGATTSGADTIYFSAEEGVLIEGDDDYTFTATVSTELENADLVSVSGSTSGTVQLEDTDTGITLTSENGCDDGTVEIYSGVDYSSDTVENDVQNILISDGDDSVVINASETSSTDTNHDYNTSGGEDTNEGESTNQSADITLGDINGDSFIDYLDAMTALRYDAELVTLSDDQLLAGDVNGDGSVDSLDAILILRYDAGLIENF